MNSQRNQIVAEGADSGTTGRRLSRAQLLMAVIVARALVPGALNYLTNEHELLKVGQTAPLAHIATLSASALTAILMVVCLGILATSLNSRTHLSASTWALIALATYETLRQGATNGLSIRESTGIVVFVLVVAALGSSQQVLSDLRILGGAGLVVSLYSIALAWLRPDNAFLHQYTDELGHLTKAIIGTALLAGPMGHSNTLGIFVALTIPFVFLFKRRWLVWSAAPLMVFVVVWSASRTSMIALGVAAIYALIWRVTPIRRRPTLATLTLGLGIASIALVPLNDQNPDGLSGRVRVWTKSMAIWRDAGSPSLGLGHWATNGELTTNSLGLLASSAHNLAVQWLVTGGAVELLLGACVLVLGARAALTLDKGRAWPVATTFMVLFLVVSSTEFLFVFAPGETVFPLTTGAFAILMTTIQDDLTPEVVLTPTIPSMRLRRVRNSTLRSRSNAPNGVSGRRPATART